jgi:transposase-like protein
MHEVFLAKGSAFVNVQDVYHHFPTEADCIAHLEKVRWNGIPQCPYCRAKYNTALPAEYRYHCNRCNTTFSVTVQTVFHHTHLPLQKWFLAISLLLTARKNVTTQQLAQDLEVNKNTAWYIAQRIRTAMLDVKQRDLVQRLGVTI